MKISTRGRYALRLMLDVARNQVDGFVTLREVSDRQDISRKYLEQIVPMLAQAGFLTGNRGKQGGYRLAKEPEDCSLKDILQMTEGSLAPVACLEEGAEICKRRDICPTLPVWQGLERVIEEYLAGVTLKDLMAQEGEEKA